MKRYNKLDDFYNLSITEIKLRVDELINLFELKQSDCNFAQENACKWQERVLQKEEENEKQRARIAELEGLCENSCAIADERFELEKANKKFESRISTIEKWLEDWSIGNGKARFPFKPGGE